MVDRHASRSTPSSAARSSWPRSAPPSADEYDAEELAEGPASRSTCSRATCASCSETIQNPSLRAAARPLLRRRRPSLGAASARRRRPSTTTRPTSAGCSSTRSRSPRPSAPPPTSSPGIDRDVAVTGALLHDIGKTEAYNDDPLAIDLTDAGRLQAEIPLGYYKVRRQIEEIEGFDPDLAQAVLHIILSHHGQLEHGSPVVPCTREATLVHSMDNLGGKLGSFDRLEKELADGESWSRFDRGIESAAFFGAPRRLAARLRPRERKLRTFDAWRRRGPRAAPHLSCAAWRRTPRS